MKVKFNSLFENNLLEGTHYDSKAAKMLVDVGLFDETKAREIIKDLYESKIHALSHADMKKYLVGIARMCIDYANGDSNKAREFLDNSTKIFDKYLTYIKDIRDKQVDKAKYDRIFMDKMSYQEVKDFVEKHEAELDQKSKDELSNMKFTSSNYELVPINSYEEFHDKFGGHWTGDGSSDKYAGGGGTAWCHANDSGVYNNWTRNGEKFFVLMNKNFKNIPFNETSNLELNGKDEYGNSLIAILVDEYGDLDKATLRCNHERNVSPADNQYETYAELSKIAGFNVEEEIKKSINFKEKIKLKDGIYYYEGGKIPNKLNSQVKTAVITADSVGIINDYAFANCKNLNKVVFQDDTTIIGLSAFSECYSLKSITFPTSLRKIDGYAFEATGLGDVIIPEGTKIIGRSAFCDCLYLQDVIIPDSVTEIGWHAFHNNHPKLVVTCGLQSPAFEYCNDNNIKVNVLLDLDKELDTELFDFLRENLKKYFLDDTDVLRQAPHGHNIKECFPNGVLQNIGSLIFTKDINLDTIDEGLDEKSFELILDLVSQSNDTYFWKNLRHDLVLDALNKNKVDIAETLSKMNIKDLYGFLVNNFIIEDTNIDVLAFARAFKEYFKQN